MNSGKDRTINPDEIFRTMREMLLEAPAEEINELAQEAGFNPKELVRTGRKLVDAAMQQCNQGNTKGENIVLLHKGLNSLLVMLRRRDGLDEGELAKNADVEEEEIRRIEYDP